jgi:hypothetical protein
MAEHGHVKSIDQISSKTKKPNLGRLGFDHVLGWLMGLEPTTTGITILDSTN